MLTHGDDYPIHQTPEPIALAGSDRNFYDRYFFNGYNSDGSVFFAAALGVYPHLNIIDGAFSVLKDGKQSCVFFSRCLKAERMDTSIGPYRVDVVQPLQRLHLSLTQTEGIACDLTFEARAHPIEEPRFTWRQGTRMVIDCTRLTQNGRWSGSIKLDDQEIAVSSDEWQGTRDRSWGVRPIGASDTQPVLPFEIPQFYWIWTPLSFADRSVFFHVNDDAHGHPWNTRAVMVPDGADEAGQAHMARCHAEVSYVTGTRRASSAKLFFTNRDNKDLSVELTPITTFQMKGIGYRHPKWTHGAFITEEPSWEREDFTPADLPWADPHNLHIQGISKAVLTDETGQRHEGIGAFEQLFAGPHAPSGFASIMDGAP
ncbi:MAG: hypothetical protein AAFS13_00375 [Pseudomonadota bacterium]